MLLAMDENPSDDSTSKPGRKRISRRSFLASGAAFGGVVLWGASAGAASTAPPMQNSPPVLNTAPVPPIIPHPTGGTSIVSPPEVTANTPPAIIDTRTGTSTGTTAGSDTPVGPDGSSGGSGRGPFFDFIPGFHFRFRNSPFNSPF
jgi:hypothetical protein